MNFSVVECCRLECRYGYPEIRGDAVVVENLHGNALVYCNSEIGKSMREEFPDYFTEIKRKFTDSFGFQLADEFYTFHWRSL